MQQQLKDQDAKDAAQLKASQTALEAAVKQAANSSNPAPTRAEDDYQRTLAGIATRRTQLRATLVATVRRALMKTMSQDQLAAMVQVGRDMRLVEREAQWIAQAATTVGLVFVVVKLVKG